MTEVILSKSPFWRTRVSQSEPFWQVRVTSTFCQNLRLNLFQKSDQNVLSARSFTESVNGAFGHLLTSFDLIFAGGKDQRTFILGRNELGTLEQISVEI